VQKIGIEWLLPAFWASRFLVKMEKKEEESIGSRTKKADERNASTGGGA